MSNITINNVQVYGLDKAIKASGNPMRTVIDNSEVTEKDFNRAKNLGNTKIGEGHDQFLTGIIVQFDLKAPLYMWKQLQRYHFIDFISSSSTMHCLTKFRLSEQCVEDTDDIILNRAQELIDEYNKAKDNVNFTVEERKQLWRRAVASLPCGFCLSASLTTNYRQLKTIYNQRKDHRLKEWHEFCEWCESLPKFKELVLNKN